MQALAVSNAQEQLLSAQLNGAKANALNASGKLDNRAAREVAEQFEAVFLSQMLGPMFETVPTDGPFGGGHAEDVYRGMMIEEVGKSIAQRGGIGIADSVYREILRMQEA